MNLEDNLALWGLKGELKKLPGDMDSNYQVYASDGQDYLLKISCLDETLEAIEFQTALLTTLAQQQRSFQFPIPKASTSGKLIETISDQEGSKTVARLFPFVPGKLLGEISPHSDLLYTSFGQQMGHLSQGLAAIEHPLSKRYLKWDIKHAGWIGNHLGHIKDSEDRAIIERCLTIYEVEVHSLLNTLRHQIIHGDLNDYNVLASRNADDDYLVSGFIDFGDAVYSVAIGELAIALAYMMMKKENPLHAGLQIIKAYHGIYTLKNEEIHCLYDLIRIRLCVSVVNSAIRKKENPQDPYLTISEKPAWNLLKQLEKISRSEFNHLILRNIADAATIS